MKKFPWTSLYNCLYLVSSHYGDIASLESPVFEVFEDLDTRITVGLNDQSLASFVSEGRFSEAIKNELSQFRDFINNIDSKYWNTVDFDHLEDWKLARDWATTLMGKLNMKRSGWDSSGEMLIPAK